MEAQVKDGAPAWTAVVWPSGWVVAEKSDVSADLNRGAGPGRKASQKTSTSDDEEW